MDASSIAILSAGGVVAGIVNTLAGGGSMLTVPLLVMLGLPGTVANGTNRVGILVQNLTAMRAFQRSGITVLRDAVPVLLPLGIGAALGALAISRVSDSTFERSFGLVMLLTLAPTLRAPRPPEAAHRPWPPALRNAVFLGIGVYGGAYQAGVGIALLLALGRTQHDLVTANAIKVVVVAALTLVALPVFVLQHQVDWGPALVLAAGFAAGGQLGARFAIHGGERLIRPVLAVAVVALSARMLGWL